MTPIAPIAPPEDGPVRLETLLRQTVEGLTALDADTLEGVVELLEQGSRPPGRIGGALALPATPLEWRRAEAQHRLLGQLLALTGRRLAALRRISAPLAPFGTYAAGDETGGFADFCRPPRWPFLGAGLDRAPRRRAEANPGIAGDAGAAR